MHEDSTGSVIFTIAVVFVDLSSSCRVYGCMYHGKNEGNFKINKIKNPLKRQTLWLSVIVEYARLTG